MNLPPNMNPSLNIGMANNNVRMARTFGNGAPYMLDGNLSPFEKFLA